MLNPILTKKFKYVNLALYVLSFSWHRQTELYNMINATDVFY